MPLGREALPAPVGGKLYDFDVTWGGVNANNTPKDDKLLEKAMRLTGIKEKTSLVRLGLEALIAKESSKRLTQLGGTEKKLEPIPRRRVSEK